MTSYLFKRLIRGILSIIAVVAIVMILIYTAMDRELIFAGDAQYTKKQDNQKESYKYMRWEVYGYLDYVPYSDYLNQLVKEGTMNKSDLADAIKFGANESKAEGANNTAKTYVKKFTSYYEEQGYEVVSLGFKPKTRQQATLFAYKNKSVIVRLLKYFGSIITVDNIHYVERHTVDAEGNPVILENKGLEFTLFDPSKNYNVSGYSLTFTNNGQTLFANIKENKGSDPTIVFEKEQKTLYTWDDTNKTFVSSVGDTLYYIGYDNFNQTVRLVDFEEMSSNEEIDKVKVKHYVLCYTTNDGENEVLSSSPISGSSFSFYCFGGDNEFVRAGFDGEKLFASNESVGTLSCEYHDNAGVSKKVFSPAILGTGTKNKYILYFDNKFPFIHQNLIKLNLGVSYAINKDIDIVQTMFRRQDPIEKHIVVYPTGQRTRSANDLHTAGYAYGSRDSFDLNKQRFTDDYTNVTSFTKSFSKTGFSFIIGIISTLISYLVGIPLGILMARKKDKLVDKLGTVYIIIIIAVPSLAYIYLLKALALNIKNASGTLIFDISFDLMNQSVGMYVLPIISLALPSIGGFMKWIRRYMIDQMNSDYVKFARSGGLSERQIFRKHILKNAIIPIVQGIPGSILGAVTGAIITESVYLVPGAGRLFTDAIAKYDNSVIVGLTLFYSSLSVISLILGDILMAIVDPRISFTDKAR